MIEVVVERRVQEAADIVSLRLVPAQPGELPAWQAGSHVDVEIRDGLVRQYSLCSVPDAADAYRIAVQREAQGRGGSQAVHDRLVEGARLRISAPRNLFALVPGARRSILFAGGIGITPLLAMAYALHAQGAEFELHYSVRSRDKAAFLQEIQASPFAGALRLHCSEDGADARLDAASAIGSPQAGVHVYACGSQRYTDAVLSAARAAGWPDAQIHYEYFSAAPVRADGDAAFEVELAGSKRVILVGAGQTIVEALAAEGVDVPTSCEQGVCGTCLTTVLGGQPDHRDMYLTDQERSANDKMLLCCSRALSPRLVLDL